MSDFGSDVDHVEPVPAPGMPSPPVAQPPKPISGAAQSDFGSDVDHVEHPDRFTPAESGILGAGNNAAFGFGDRIGGGALGLYRYLMNKHAGSLPDEYNKARAEGHQAYAQAKAENPVGYAVGSGAGMLAGGAEQAAVGIPRAASMAGRFARAGAQGTAMGLGDTPDLTNVPQAAEDAAVGAGAGMVGHGVLGEAAPWAVRGGAKGVRNVLGSVVFGVPSEATERFSQRPAAVQGAKPLEEQARNFAGDVKAAGQELSADSTRGFEMLKNSGITTSHHSFTAPLQDAITEINSTGVYGPARREGIKYLNDLSRDVESDFTSQGNGGQLGLDRGKNLVMALQNKIDEMEANHGDPIVLRALRGARQAVDGQLKTQVPEYAAHMADVEQRTVNLKALGSGLGDGDNPQKTMNTMKGVMRGARPFDKEAMQALDAQNGTNYTEQLQDSYAKRAFEQPTTNGSRRAVGGAVMGAAAGALGRDPILGAALTAAGVGTGLTLDRYGGKIWMQALRAGAIPAKFAGLLNSAAQRGGAAPAVTHELLMKQYPEYRAAIENLISSQGAPAQ